jgi:hypothetical protein
MEIERPEECRREEREERTRLAGLSALIDAIDNGTVPQPADEAGAYYGEIEDPPDEVETYPREYPDDGAESTSG